MTLAVVVIVVVVVVVVMALILVVNCLKSLHYGQFYRNNIYFINNYNILCTLLQKKENKLDCFQRKMPKIVKTFDGVVNRGKKRPHHICTRTVPFKVCLIRPDLVCLVTTVPLSAWRVTRGRDSRVAIVIG